MAWVSTVSDIGHFDYSYARFYTLNVEGFVVEISIDVIIRTSKLNGQK